MQTFKMVLFFKLPAASWENSSNYLGCVHDSSSYTGCVQSHAHILGSWNNPPNQQQIRHSSIVCFCIVCSLKRGLP